MNAETRAALALVEAGLAPGQVDLALRMVDWVESDTAEAIGTKVAGLVEQMPALFPQQTGGRPATGGQARPPAAGAPPALKAVETDYEKGQRLAREQYAHLRMAPDRSQLTPAERAQARFDATHGRPGGGSAA